ncbi:MAG: tyrosine-type recombinase/integrase, partial [Nitrososphaerales archaeon]
MTGPTAPTDPIRDKSAIARIKANLADHPRNYALFIIGVNTAFRASDILGLNVGDVRDRVALSIKEKKTGKRRVVPLNPVVIQALKPLIDGRDDDEPLFIGEKRGTRMVVETLGRLWKGWCKEAGLRGTFSSHTGRKTWGFQQRMGGASLDLLQKAYGHSSGAITMIYAGIQDEE